MSTLEESPPSDATLFAAWCHGDLTAGNELFQRYLPSLHRFFRQTSKNLSDTEDLVQKTLLAIVSNRHKFRSEGSFKSFLFGVARHRLYAYWRHRARHDEVFDFVTTSLADLGATPATQCAVSQDRQRLMTALGRIPLEQQLVLMLFYWEAMDHNALAEVFEIAPATARTRLHRARIALRKQFEGGVKPSSRQPASHRTAYVSTVWARP